MHYSTLALLSLAGYAATQSIPTCADTCFLAAIEKSGCQVTDYLCQCTTGMKVISQNVLPCLCKSTCSPAELLQVHDDTNSICSSALSSAGKPFTAAPLTTNACQLLTAGTSTTTSTGSTASTMTSSGKSTTVTSATTKPTTTTGAVPKSTGSSMSSMSSSASSMSSTGSASVVSSSSSAASGNFAPMVTMAPQMIMGGLAAAGMLL